MAPFSDNETENSKKADPGNRSFWHSSLAGILLMVVGVSLFALNDAFTKLISNDYGVVQAVWGRSIFCLITVLALVPRRRFITLLASSRPGTQVLRGLMPLFASLLVITSLQYLSLARTTAILFTAPIMVSAFSGILLGERSDIFKWIAVSLGFIGVLFIVRPGSDLVDWHSLLPLVAAVFIAAYQMLSRSLAQTINPITSMMYLAVVATIGSSLPLLFYWKTPGFVDLLFMGATGIIYALSHSCYIWAHGRASAVTLAPLVYAQVLSATAVGYFLFNEFLDVTSIIGILIISAAGLIIFFRERSERIKSPDL